MAAELISFPLHQPQPPDEDPVASDWKAAVDRLQAECTRLKELLADTEEAADLALERQVASAEERVRADFEAKLEALKAEFAVERDDLEKKHQAASEAAMGAQKELIERSAQWQSVGSDSSKEVDTLKIELEQSHADNQRLKEECERLKESVENALRQQKGASIETARTEAILLEVARVEGQIREIVARISDSDTDLDTLVRKNVERSQMEAYLDGLRFAIDGSGN